MASGKVLGALVIAFLFVGGCEKKPPPPDDLKALSAERERAEVKKLSEQYPNAGITLDEPLVDAQRAALKASEPKTKEQQTPREPGSQAAKLLESTGK